MFEINSKPLLQKRQIASVEPNGIFKFISTNYTLKEKLLSVTILITLLQFLLHLGSINAYGFHQDELLYMALSEHLSWGYRETPPFIAFMGALGKTVFGNSLTATRIIPALCAGAIVHLTGVITIRLNGKYLAVIIACTTVAFSPAFLATGALFIPQVFDELFWLLSAYLLICFVQKGTDKYLYVLGLVIGIGILVKYTIVIYILGMLFGLSLSDGGRKIWSRKSFYVSIFISFLVILPHIIWQFQNGFPALMHFQELKETQLIYISPIDFTFQQLVVNGTGVFVWLAGIWYLSRNNEFKDYRFLLWGFIIVMTTLVILNGKPYYGFGAFPALFAIGGIYLERVFRTFTKTFKSSFIGVMQIPNLFLSLVVLPYLPIENASAVFEWTYTHLNIQFPLKWEDQKIHNMNQNYADMIGWDELASKVSRIYLSMDAKQRQQTIFYIEGYGAAGAADYYCEQYPLPKIVSLSSSFAMWAPSKINAKNIIFFSTIGNLPAAMKANSRLVDKINNRFSRVYGEGIYLVKNIHPNAKNWYASQWKKTHYISIDLYKKYVDVF
ncbi:glycosyltransferase family 39 protein [Pedobacter mucosus]|uniref:glycosyltransferase family 39 protein n=1 Tax=Pedobacter mucosus TaxID=2895286 RepID=UPI001EE4206F|nr:glycosyltransferase family 39 protein [Pedobacter mucosus]UKT65833.1 glycosyltransferase family 39 protein [Pedobacter mucosus]